MQLLTLCNPENRRIDYLRKAAERTGWSLKLVAYQDLLSGTTDLASAGRQCVAARIDSPGENFSVERMLLARGAALGAEQGFSTMDAGEALRLEYELGRIHYPYQYYLGFASLLQQVDAQLAHVRWMNSPRAVATMFDKVATAHCLQRAGVPIPQQLGVIRSFDELHDLMLARKKRRVFVKLTTSSSASGVVAIVRYGARFRAVTTVERVLGSNKEVRLYNSLKLQTLHDTQEIAELVDGLVPHRAMVEDWLPKAAYDHRSTFDMRAVVIDNQTTHFVPRVSSSPMTNLHLGNRRGDWAIIRKRLGDSLDRFAKACTRAASALPGAFYCGLDVVVDPSLRRFHMLEANACGDLLPGVVDTQGYDTYTTQLTRLKLQIGQQPSGGTLFGTHNVSRL